eukprot:384117-Rhodomonas_salina.2
MLLCILCAVCGAELGYAATAHRHPRAQRGLLPGMASYISLRAPYAMSGTGVAYAPTSYARATPYPTSGTDVAYGGTRHGQRRSQGCLTTSSPAGTALANPLVLP